jgi:hypothetical protein
MLSSSTLMVHVDLHVCLLSMFVNSKCSDLSKLAKLVFMSNADLAVC